jgi:hypothetical protein
LRGKTTSNNLRTCETVSAGAFFFQLDLEMPQKEMGQHTGQHMVMPARGFAHFIVGHAQFGFRFLETLFNGPPHPTEPDQQAQGHTPGGVAEIVPVLRMGSQRPLDEQPDDRGRLPVLTQPDPFARAFVGQGTCGPFGYGAAIPERRRDVVREGRNRTWHPAWHRHTLRALLPFIGRRVRGGRERLEPTPGVRWRRDERDGAHTRLAGCPKVRTVAIQAIRHNILEGQHPKSGHTTLAQ